MGCDYYVIRALKIKYNNDPHINENTCVDCECTNCTEYIELSCERCYFPIEYDNDDGNYDSDDYYDSCTNIKSIDDWNKFFNEKYAKYLEVKYKPRILFQNGEWKNEYVQHKYEHLIQNKNFLTVTKIEIRRLR